jgi:hypothetical protein
MRILVAIAIALLTVTGSALAKSFVGTNGPDLLVGTPRADALFGKGGNDRIFGKGGADLLVGGPGSDLLDGGPGDDRIAAEYDGARDTVRCGPGLDVVNADPIDRVAADCELVGRRLSRDPYGDPQGQHETEVEPDSLSVGSTTVAAFQVGRRFTGGAANIGYSRSTDGGRTWQSGFLPALTAASTPAGPNQFASDAAVGYDATHGVWLIAALAIDGATTRLTISRSSDGLTWSAPVVAAEALAGATPGGDESVAFDKEWVACDNGSASPFRGRCYLAYSDDLRAGRLGVISSSDGGSTWSAPVEPPADDIVGAFPVIRPDGELVVPYLAKGIQIGVVTSTDGAQTFTAPATVSDVQARATPGLRFFPLPSAAVDPSGRVWIAWHDCRYSTSCSANDIVVSTSSDGVTWTDPVAVTSGRNAVLPAIGIDPGTGRVAIAYYTVNGTGIDAELVMSSAGTPSGFGPPRRLSAQTMSPSWLPNTVTGRMLADYISVDFAGSRPVVVWALASPPVGTSYRQATYATRG